MSRVDATERSREWRARAKTEALALRMAREAQRRKRDELRQETGLHDSVRAEINKRAAENERAMKAAEREEEQAMAEARAHDARVQLELTRRARAAETVQSTFARQAAVVASQRDQQLARLDREDARRQQDLDAAGARDRALSPSINCYSIVMLFIFIACSYA